MRSFAFTDINDVEQRVRRRPSTAEELCLSAWPAPGKIQLMPPQNPMPAARIVPGPGQESVWGFPRPPRVEPSTERVVVRFAGQVLVDSTEALRVLETSHPPVYYLLRSTFPDGALVAAPGSSLCEFKGAASYFDLRLGKTVARRAAWYYPAPLPGYEQLRDRVAVFPAMMDSCEVDGELVIPQEGGFYGGWITSKVVGPFKGGPGTLGW